LWETGAAATQRILSRLRASTGPRGAARVADPGGGGPGEGVAGYSHELLRGALIYAARGIPAFPCE
jgi:hypothetical protein